MGGKRAGNTLTAFLTLPPYKYQHPQEKRSNRVLRAFLYRHTERGMTLAYRKGQENLIPVTQRPDDERKELCRKGGIRSGEVRRQKRDARSMAALVLDCVPTMPAIVKQQMKELNLGEKKPDALMISMGANIRKAMAGDLKSLEFLLKLTGQMPDKTGMVPGEASSEPTDDEFDEQHIRETLDNMTDDQLRSYQELCGMFATRKETEE